jgi:threonyl-tRNA synthetase
VEVDESGERIAAKIREAQVQKVPYMLVVGDKEVEANTVSVRLRSEADRGPMAIDDVIREIQEAIADKRYN